MHIYRTGQDVTVLNDHLEVPGIGFIPANAYVLHARQPVVVDTGLHLQDDAHLVLRRDDGSPAWATRKPSA